MDPEERQDRRLDQRRALAGVASQARRRPIMRRSREADLLHGILHNQGVGITCFWPTLAKSREALTVYVYWGASSSVCRAEMRSGVLGGCLGRRTAFGSVRELMPYGSCVSEINGSATFSWSAAPRDLFVEEHTWGPGRTALCLLECLLEYTTTVQYKTRTPCS